MKFDCTIKNLRTGEYDTLYTFSPLKIGSTIKWGGDDSAPDGLAVWIVIDCRVMDIDKKPWER